MSGLEGSLLPWIMPWGDRGSVVRVDIGRVITKV